MKALSLEASALSPRRIVCGVDGGSGVFGFVRRRPIEGPRDGRWMLIERGGE